MIVYKLVSKDRNGDFVSYSYNWPNPEYVKYFVRKTTRPKVGYLFAFRTLKAAKSLDSNAVILKCQAKTVRKPKWINILVMDFLTHGENKLRYFWEEQVNPESGFGIPKGTVFCSHITPMKEIKK